jgi:hypothetical protein
MSKPVIIRLMEPDLCLECRFAQNAVVEYAGKTEKVIKCLRLDCDNWIREGAEVIDEIREDNSQ